MKKLNSIRRSLPASLLIYVLALAGIYGYAQTTQPRTVIHDMASGSITIPATVASDPIDYLIISTLASGATTTNRIIVQPYFTGNITLKDVQILQPNSTMSDGWTTAGQDEGLANCIDIQNNAHVTLKLMGTNVMKSPQSGSFHAAAIRVAKDGYLTIESYDGVDSHGSLEVMSARGIAGAAIGGNWISASNLSHYSTSGHITINSGTITTTGGDDSAGIGGSSYGGAGGWITINGGIVRATCDATSGGANSGAAIGSGYACSSTDTYITITGGTIYAVSIIQNGYWLNGAAIGAGNASGDSDALYNSTSPSEGNFGYILITGGKIKASVRGLFDAAGNHIPPPTVGGVTWSGGLLEGKDGVAIGGGARAGAKGTIIILPSADVSELYGGTKYNKNHGYSGWDIGNCSTLFYLNKSNPWVCNGTYTNRQQAKSFTARLGDYKTGEQIFARIYAADQFPEIASYASQVGVTSAGTGGIIGSATGCTASDVLYYYLGSTTPAYAGVDFFTNATPTTPGQSYEIATYANGSTVAPMPTNQGYNISSPQYDVILNLATPTYDFKLSQGWEVAPTPGSVITNCNQQITTLDFGTATYDRYGPSAPGSFKTKMALSIKNTGTGWLDIQMDPSSNVRYFDLEGPVVAAPPFNNGASVPIGTTGTITATLRNQIPVGNHTDTIALVAHDPSGTPYNDTIFLKIIINQKQVNNTDGEYATVTAKNPDPPASIMGPAVKTNSTVRLNARASAPDIDGVKNVWYKFSGTQVDPDESNAAGWVPTDDVNGWKLVAATATDGKFGYNFLLGNIEFPQPDGVYYIHWFVETVNTIGSRSGVIGPYDVNRTRPMPTISGPNTIGAAPVTLTITFDNSTAIDILASDPAEGMFSVSHGSIVASSVAVTTAGLEYTFQVQATGDDNVSVTFPQNRVKDVYGNQNQASNTYVLTLSNGRPMPNFSTVDSVYFTPPSGGNISFSVGAGGMTNDLYLSDGTTLVSSANGAGTFTVNGSTPTLNSFTAGTNIYSVGGISTTGSYAIRFVDDAVKNDLGTGILDTTYIFRVYTISISTNIPGTYPNYVFPAQNEGYSVPTTYSGTINNPDPLPLSGLNVTLGGANPTAFTVNTSAMATTIASGSTTFPIAPAAGLLQGTYTATITVRSYNRVIGTLTVSFTVTKLPAPNAKIDYINETLINLSTDTAYVFNDGSPVKPNDDGAVGIPETWMNDVVNGLKNEAADPVNTSARSAAQYITVPSRPAAPVLTVQEETGYQFADGVIMGVNDSMEYRIGATGEWISLPANIRELDGLTGGTYYVRYKAIQDKQFSSYITVINVITRFVPVVMRDVVMPYVAGITSFPTPGTYRVISQYDFAFTLTFNGAPLIVRTNRTINGAKEVLNGVLNASGGYDYIISRVQEGIKIEIGPETVANESIASVAVWASENAINIETPERTRVDIYSIAGVLVKRMDIAGGITT
ncbi:MAG: hypothetical protein LBR50_04415, partial [Tannerella sp.]|nr:hypothetical protein [Tannerella sp.]